MGSHSSVHSFLVEQNHPNWFTHLPSNTRIEYLSRPQVVRPQPNVAAAKNVAVTGSGTWKIFGVNLNSNPPKSDPVTEGSNVIYQLESCSQPAGMLHQSSHVIEVRRSFELSKSSKSVESASAGSEQEKGHQPSPQAAKDILSKPLASSRRNCIKVHKQGIALGRSVDLSRFNGYDELVAELDRMLEFEGELMSPSKGWMVVCTDSEGDMMLVGDDPWQEFCSMVRKIYIYMTEEVQKMNTGTLSPITQETSIVAEEKTTEKEMKSPVPTSAANPEKS